MNRLLIDPGDIADDNTVKIGGDRAWHIRKILKLQVGDHLRAGIVNGAIGDAEVLEIDKHHVRVRLSCSNQAMPLAPITLLLALPRPRMMNRLWSLAASFGVSRIMVTGAGRVEKSYFDSRVLEEPVIREQLITGLEQGGVSTALPVSRLFSSLSECLAYQAEEIPDDHDRWLFESGGTAFHDKLVAPIQAGSVLAVGPEGGWLEKDIDQFEDHGFEKLSLGPRVVRTEAACISVLGAVMISRESRLRGH